MAQSFKGRFQEKCLPMAWFGTGPKPQLCSKKWRRHYNKAYPHSSLSKQTPAAFKK